MFEINMTCPVCGSFTWENVKNDSGAEKFKCTDCGKICTVEEMEYQCFSCSR